MTKKQPREHSRPRNRRPLKDAVYFVCEGETEEKYIRALQQMLPLNNVAFKILSPTRRGSDWKSLVRSAQNLERRMNEHVWIVADVNYRAKCLSEATLNRETPAASGRLPPQPHPRQ